MSYWSQQARNKRMNEKHASKKTREGLMDAYHRGRAMAEQRQKEQNLDRERKNSLPQNEGMERFQVADHQGEGAAVRVVRDQEDGQGT